MLDFKIAKTDNKEYLEAVRLAKKYININLIDASEFGIAELFPSLELIETVFVGERKDCDKHMYSNVYGVSRSEKGYRFYLVQIEDFYHSIVYSMREVIERIDEIQTLYYDVLIDADVEYDIYQK